MPEYIEREAVIEKNHGGVVYIDDIKNIPVADAAPVRHGQWLPFHSAAAGDIQYCSACEIGCTWKPNYCPNCGAKMMEG